MDDRTLHTPPADLPSVSAAGEEPVSPPADAVFTPGAAVSAATPLDTQPAVQPDTAVDPEPAAVTHAPSLVDRLFGWMGGRSAQIAALTDAIADAPTQPMNYVRRGELRLQQGDFDGAAADFERGLALAREQLPADRWGLIAQAAQDRAAAGLADIRARADVEG